MLFRHRPKTPIETIELEARELKREYKHFQKFRDENSLLFGVFVLGLAALIVINTVFWADLTAKNAARDATNQAVASGKIATSQQTARNVALRVTVKDVTTNSAADPAFGIADDETMLIMHMTVTNTSPRTQQFIPVSQLYARSNEGDYSILHASTNVKDPIPAGDLAPGKSVSGEVSFAVKKRIVSPLVYIDTGWEATTPLVIDALH